MHLLDGKGEVVKYAAPGENVQIRLNIADEDMVRRGDVLCHRENMMPVTELFEAEIDVLDLLEYKPILSKGYTCVMHIHTFADEVIIKDIMKSEEINDKGEKIVKQKPNFTKSHTKIICRVVPKVPLALEKFDTIQQMGRFTLRDEGATIAVGKVLKYKPFQKGIVGASKDVPGGSGAKPAASSITAGFQTTNTINQGEELVYDMETGEMKPKAKQLDALAEEDENEDD